MPDMPDFDLSQWGGYILDSRDIIARLDDVDDELDDDDLDDSERTELENERDALRHICAQGEDSPDWPYGETLIHDDYFVEWAKQLADDIGAIDANAGWPLAHIDWEAAADALRQDYFEIEWDGHTYWLHS